MRMSRVFMAAGLAPLVAVGSAAILSAQAKTDEDDDKLMKAVGAANGTMAKATDAPPSPAKPGSFRPSSRKRSSSGRRAINKEAAEYAALTMRHAAEIEKAATANNMESVAAHRKELGGVRQACHKANREKTETGFAIRKG